MESDAHLVLASCLADQLQKAPRNAVPSAVRHILEVVVRVIYELEQQVDVGLVPAATHSRASVLLAQSTRLAAGGAVRFAHLKKCTKSCTANYLRQQQQTAQ